MSTDPKCVYCNAPLEDDVYRCDRCGNKNANFNRPEPEAPVVNRPVSPPANGFDLVKKKSSPPVEVQKTRPVIEPVNTPARPQRTEPANPRRTQTPTPPRVSPMRGNRTVSFFEQGTSLERTLTILMGVIAVAAIVIASNSRLYSYLFYGLGEGPGAGLSLMILFMGPICAYWAVRSFIQPASPWRHVAKVFWLVMQIVHLVLFQAPSP
jgi:hypothetical protein